MSNFNPPNLIPALEFLSDCLVAITENEYRTALERARTGLEGLLKDKETIDAQNLISGFYMVILHLGSTLEKAYGDKWEQLVPEITEDDRPMRCSFCGKNHTEVENLIAGPKVYICDECVEICNQVLENGSDSRLN